MTSKYIVRLSETTIKDRYHFLMLDKHLRKVRDYYGTLDNARRVANMLELQPLSMPQYIAQLKEGVTS